MQHQLVARRSCWVILGIDDFLGKLPAPWVRYREAGDHAAEGVSFVRVGSDIVFLAGPVGRVRLGGYRRSVAAVVRSGVNVIVDEVVLDEEAWDQWESGLPGASIPSGSACRLPDRGVRGTGACPVGSAPGPRQSQSMFVHRHPHYGVAGSDTSKASPAELAQAVLAAYTAPPGWLTSVPRRSGDA